MGSVVEIADKQDLYGAPLHPYTRALLSAIPIPDANRKRNRIILEGDVDVYKRQTQYEGGYTDYQAAFAQKYPEGVLPSGVGAGKKSSDAKEGKKTVGKPKGEQKLKFSFKEQREWDTIEETIAALEEKIADLDAQIEQCASNYTKLSELMEEKRIQEQLLEEKMERWMVLNDLAEQIEKQ